MTKPIAIIRIFNWPATVNAGGPEYVEIKRPVLKVTAKRVYAGERIW